MGALGFTPLGNRIIAVAVEEKEQQTPGGIFLPETSRKRPHVYEVVALGDGEEVDALNLEVGAKLFAGAHAPIPLEWEEREDLVLLQPRDIIGLVDPPADSEGDS